MTLVLGLALPAELRSFGVGIVRVYVAWHRVSPAIQPLAPYNPSDPKDPRYKRGVYDRIVRATRTEGLAVRHDGSCNRRPVQSRMQKVVVR